MPNPLISKNIAEDIISRLQNPSIGHSPYTMGPLSQVIGTQFKESSAQFTACFDPHSAPNLEHFKEFLRYIKPPKRYHIPLGVGSNHITALIVDIDSNGKADVLFFNSLGNSNQGNYYKEAKWFIDAVHERFPQKNAYHVTKSFQDLSQGDIFCGDWSMWFLKESAAMPHLSLQKIRDHFDSMDKNVIPKPRELRARHIRILEDYNNANAVTKSPPSAHIPNTKHVRPMAQDPKPESESSDAASNSKKSFSDTTITMATEIKNKISGQETSSRLTTTKSGKKINILTIFCQYLENHRAQNDSDPAKQKLILALFKALCDMKRHPFNFFHKPHSSEEYKTLLRDNNMPLPKDVSFTQAEVSTIKSQEDIKNLLVKKAAPQNSPT